MVFWKVYPLHVSNKQLSIIRRSFLYTQHTVFYHASMGCLAARHPIDVSITRSLLVQLKDILKEERRGKVTKGGLVLARQCPASPGTCNPEESSLTGLPMSWSPTQFSGSGPVGLPPVPWPEKTIERSPFFVRRGGHCCRGDLFGRIIFWIFWSGLQKLERRAKKCIELCGEHVKEIPSLFAVACFLPGRAKDLSAPRSNRPSATAQARPVKHASRRASWCGVPNFWYVMMLYCHSLHFIAYKSWIRQN